MRNQLGWMAWVVFALPSLGFVGVTVADEESVEYAEDHAAEVDHDGESHSDGHSDAEGASHDDAAHGDSHGGNANPLSVDPDLMIFTAIVFLLLLAVLRKFAWGPISRALEDREQGIEGQIAEAHRSNEEARRLLAEHEAKLAAATESIREMTDQARRDAELRKQEIIAEAEAAAAAQKDRALREINAAKNSALEDLAKSSVDQAVGLASRIVGHQLNRDDHAKLIQDALQQFPSDN